MTKPVITPAEEEAYSMAPEPGSRTFGADIREVAGPLGLTRIGAMHVTVQPGMRAFPFHNHLGKDEMFVILSGTGTLRYGKDTYPVAAGDVCAASRGGQETAHQLINTGMEPLVYIGISNMCDPDIVEYPDSGKFAALGVFPGTSFFDAHLKYVGRAETSLDYWEGEDT